MLAHILHMEYYMQYPTCGPVHRSDTVVSRSCPLVLVTLVRGLVLLEIMYGRLWDSTGDWNSKHSHHDWVTNLNIMIILMALANMSLALKAVFLFARYPT